MNFLNVGMWFCFGRFDFIICDFGCVCFWKGCAVSDQTSDTLCE